MKITTDKALITSAIILISYTISSQILIAYDKQPDSTLTTCLFLAFGVAEGGYCTYIHNLRKKRKMKKNEISNPDYNSVNDLGNRGTDNEL